MPATRLRRVSRLTAAGSVAALAVVAIAPHGLAAPATPEQPVTASFVQTSDYCADNDEQAVLGLINAYRADNGLPPLTMSQTLGAAAQTHSADMAATDVFDHTMSDGTSVLQNIREHGYAGTTYGENIAGGVDGPDAAFSLWQSSPSHNENMLRAAYQSIGIGRAENPDTGEGWYWTTIFGGALDVPATLCGQTPPSTTSQAPAGPSLPAPPGAGNASATDDVNLRSGPGTDFAILGSVPSGSRLAVTGALNAGYYPVDFGDQSGWVSADYVALDPAAAAASATTASRTATTTDALNLRDGPSRRAAILETIPAGAAVTLTGRSDGGYLGVSYNGTPGWADAAYLAIPESATQPATADATQPATFAQPATPATTATTTDDLNLRSGPSQDAPILLVIPAGTTVDLTGEHGSGYLGVSYQGTVGWGDAAYLS